MKRSVLINFLKCLLLAAGVSLVSLSASAQLSLTGFHGNFGIDADTRAKTTKYGTAPSPNNGDDWFSSITRGVIDTSNASFYKSQLQNNRNISFIKSMSAPLFSTINNKLWLDAFYVRDHTSVNGKDSTAYGISAKNGMSPTSWNGRPESIPVKTDIIDAYAHMRRDGLSVADSLWFFTGVSTVGTNGDRYFDIELFKKYTSYNMGTGKFTAQGLSGGRTEWLFDPFGNIIQTGDLIISVSYKAGQAPVIDVRIWVSRLTHQLIRPRLFRFGNEFDGGLLFGYAPVVSTNNTTAFGSGCGNYSGSGASDTTYSTPWGSINTGGNWSEQYDRLQFVEVGLNLTRMGLDPGLYSTLSACERIFHSAFFKSRSSNSFTANLQDFAGPVQMADPTVPFNIGVDAATLTCNNPVGELSISNPSSVGLFSWTTPNGNILGSNEDSSVIQVNKKGVYFLTARLAKGCAVNRMELFQVYSDMTPPVASADMTLTAAGEIQLLGGDPLLSNILTPFGGSKGLEWKWSGPYGFTSTEQNPIINTDWVYGAYYLTLKELRNGCVAYASLDMSFSAKFDKSTSANLRTRAMEVTGNNTETMTLQQSGIKLYLAANQNESSQLSAVFYSTGGQLLGKQDIYLNKGYSNIELSLPAKNQVSIVAIYKGRQLVYSRKVHF